MAIVAIGCIVILVKLFSPKTPNETLTNRPSTEDLSNRNYPYEEEVAHIVPKPKEQEISVTDEEIVMLAKTVFGEARGVQSRMEQAGVIWCVFNRVDKRGKTVTEILTEPGNFAYDPDFPTIDDYGRDLIALASDVKARWYREHIGIEDVGRVLPADYLYFGGDGERNWFRKDYYDLDGDKWDWSLPNPYKETE